MKLALSQLIRVDRDRRGESGHRAQAGRDTQTKNLSQLEPGVPIHLVFPNPPRLLVYYYELLSTGVNWDRQCELGQAELSRGNGDF